jgi:hypothetical protein
MSEINFCTVAVQFEISSQPCQAVGVCDEDYPLELVKVLGLGLGDRALKPVFTKKLAAIAAEGVWRETTSAAGHEPTKDQLATFLGRAKELEIDSNVECYRFPRSRFIKKLSESMRLASYADRRYGHMSYVDQAEAYDPNTDQYVLLRVAKRGSTLQASLWGREEARLYKNGALIGKYILHWSMEKLVCELVFFRENIGDDGASKDATYKLVFGTSWLPLIIFKEATILLSSGKGGFYVPPTFIECDALGNEYELPLYFVNQGGAAFGDFEIKIVCLVENASLLDHTPKKIAIRRG